MAIVGAPNVGKSSLFNALLNANRAIVTAIPGTTRDLLTEQADIGGLSLSLIDTAGVRDTADVVEQEGVARAKAAVTRRGSDDRAARSIAAAQHDDRELLGVTAAQPRVIVWNKMRSAAVVTARAARSRRSGGDLGARPAPASIDLIAAIGEALGSAARALRDRPQVTNVRHAVLLERAQRVADARGHRARVESLRRISAARSSGSRRRAAGDHRPADDGRSAAAHLRALLHRQVSSRLTRGPTPFAPADSPCALCLKRRRFDSSDTLIADGSQ